MVRNNFNGIFFLRQFFNILFLPFCQLNFNKVDVYKRKNKKKTVTSMFHYIRRYVTVSFSFKHTKALSYL